MWLFLPEYFLEDCIQMTQFVPPPKDKKKKDKEDDGGEDDDVSRFLCTPTGMRHVHCESVWWKRK